MFSACCSPYPPKEILAPLDSQAVPLPIITGYSLKYILNAVYFHYLLALWETYFHYYELDVLTYVAGYPAHRTSASVALMVVSGVDNLNGKKTIR